MKQVPRPDPLFRAEQTTAMIPEPPDAGLRQQVRARLSKRDLFAATGFSSIHRGYWPPVYCVRPSDRLAHA